MANELTTQTEDALNSLFDALNKMGGSKDVEEGLRNVLNHQHRTLQQNFMRQILVPAIRIFAEKDRNGYKDLRNEASCELATKLLPLVDREPLPYV